LFWFYWGNIFFMLMDTFDSLALLIDPNMSRSTTKTLLIIYSFMSNFIGVIVLQWLRRQYYALTGLRDAKLKHYVRVCALMVVLYCFELIADVVEATQEEGEVRKFFSNRLEGFVSIMLILTWAQGWYIFLWIQGTPSEQRLRWSRTIKNPLRNNGEWERTADEGALLRS